MTDTILLKIETSLIDVPENRLRRVRPELVAAMAATMRDRGQLQPIRVAKSGNRYQLVDGAIRVAAAAMAGLADLDAVILPEGATEDQLLYDAAATNLIRGQLTKLERAEHLVVWDRVTKELGLRKGRGGDRRSKRVAAVQERNDPERELILREIEGDPDQTHKMCVWSEMLDKVQIGRMDVTRARTIVEGLKPAAKEQIRGTWLEDSQSELLALAQLETGIDQLAVIGKILDPDCPASKTAEALLIMQGRMLPRAQDKAYNTTCSNWAKLDKPNRIGFVTNNWSEISKAAKAAGLID